MSKKKKKKKKKGESEEEKIYSLQQKLEKSNRQIETYERLLVLRSEQANSSRLEKEQMGEKLEKLNQDFERELKDRFSIASDMIRQYKAMEGELIDKISKANQKASHLEDELSYANIALDKQDEKHKKIIYQKDKEIESQKQKMEEMVVEFQDMFAEVLKKMNSTITDTTGQDGKKLNLRIFQNPRLKDIITDNK